MGTVHPRKICDPRFARVVVTGGHPALAEQKKFSVFPELVVSTVPREVETNNRARVESFLRTLREICSVTGRSQ